MKHSISMVGSLFVLFTAIAFSQIREKLSLHDAINIAVQNNPEILASRHEIDAAAGRVLQAGRFPNPEFSISFNESPANFAIGDANEKDFGISQTFEFPGKRSSRIEVAEQEQTFSELTVARKTAIVATQVKQIYYQALLAAAIKENITFNIALLDDLLETVTLRYQSGANTYLEILRVKIEKTRLSNDAVEAERDYRLRIGNLKTILGKSVDADIALSDSLVYEPFRMAEDSALSVLTEQSYYLKMKEQELLIQQSAYNLAEKSYLPDLKFGLALQNRLGTFPDEGSKNYLGLEVGVSLPLWFQQGPKGEVQEALALTRATEYRLTAARQ
ncbi:MAG: TolC family protein, partial [Bacteroidetes bacterium]